jgi:DNA-binding response OmpR family regulator
MMPRAEVHRRRSPIRPDLQAAEAGRSVLIVTGDDTLASVCRGALSQDGYDVTVATHSGHALLECLSGRRTDLLLTELSMPDGSGPALAERLRRYFPDLRTVYVANAGTLVEDPNVLVRPFSRDELLSRIRASITASPAS